MIEHPRCPTCGRFMLVGWQSDPPVYACPQGHDSEEVEKTPEDHGHPDHVQFEPEEWERATRLAVHLLDAIRREARCESCDDLVELLPNYRMKYRVALALREAEASRITNPSE